jgi:hypothetical protein
MRLRLRVTAMGQLHGDGQEFAPFSTTVPPMPLTKTRPWLREVARKSFRRRIFVGLTALSLFIVVIGFQRVWVSWVAGRPDGAMLVDGMFSNRLNPVLTYVTLMCLLLTFVRQSKRMHEMQAMVKRAQQAQDTMACQTRQARVSAKVLALNVALRFRRSRFLDREAGNFLAGHPRGHWDSVPQGPMATGDNWYPGMFDNASDDDGRAIKALTQARRAFARLLGLAETRHGRQSFVVSRFIASSCRSGENPFDLSELRKVDVSISDDLLCCMDALRWGGRELYDLVHDGERRVRAMLATWASIDEASTHV